MTGTGFRNAGRAATVLLAAALWLGAGVAPVLAACTPDTALLNPAGDTVTCSGTTDNQNPPHGYGNGLESNVTVNVLSGATVTGTDIGIALNNNATIHNSGSISGNFSGVEANNITSLTNSGSITGTGATGDGIFAGTITSLSNSGFITGNGNNNAGIDATTITSLSNSGTITGDNRGISASGSIGTLTNSGSITGRTDAGINANDSITSLSNSGSISGSNRGINASGSIGTLTNSGSITATGTNSIGIFAINNITSLTNSGSISGDRGIVASAITSLTNSGLISGVGAVNNLAIQKSIGDMQLTLLAGSVLVGQVNLGGGVNTLNVGKGLSMATTILSGTPLEFGRMSVPFVVNGTQVITADTTSLANHSTMVADLTGGIFSTVENRLDNLRGGVSSFAQPMLMAYEADAAASGPFAGFGSGSGSVDRSRQVWMQAFGSFRQQEGTSTTLDSQQKIGGLVSGIDVGSGPNRAGIFFGAAGGASVVDAQAGKTTNNSFFGGAYSSTQVGRGFIDLAFTAGYSSFDRERRISNNQVAGGTETAKADYHGWFVSPEIRFVQPVGALEGSLTLRYAGLFLDGFNESGVSVGAMTVGSKDIHLGIARAALSLPLTKNYSDGAQARWIYTAGIEGRTQFGGDHFSGTLAGQGIAFTAGARDTAGLFGSYRAELASPLGHTVYAVVEGLAEADGSYQLSGKAGFRVRY